MKNQKKFKLAIIIESFENIKDYEINLLSKIVKNQNFSTRIYTDLPDPKILFSKKLLLNFFFSIIYFVERKFLRVTRSAQINFIKKNILSIKKLDHKNLKLNDNLNLIINLTNNNLEYNDLCKKFTIWTIKNNQTNFKNLYGFFETLKNLPLTKCILLESKNTKHQIIDEGLYATQKYWLHNSEFLKEKSVNLFVKNLEAVICKNKTNLKINFHSNLNKEIKSFHLAQYIFVNLLMNIFYKIYTKIFVTNKIWNIYYRNDKFTNLKFNNSTKLISPKNYYWADPFLIIYKGIKYIFFENFDVKKNKGKISAVEIKNNKIINQYDILKKNYHLSYPFIFTDKNNFYLIPESSQNKLITVWKSINFPKKWVRLKELFKGEHCADPTLFKDKKGVIWLFINKSIDKYNDHNSELYIYKVKDLSFNNLVPHKKNPVITNSGNARNAGNLFYVNNSLFRPAQVNHSNIYGSAIMLKKITKLTISEYIEKPIKKITLKDKKIHHLSIGKSGYSFDVFE